MDRKNIAFLFPGQGSHYIGMGKELYENFKECRDIFNEANEALNFNIGDLCFNGPEYELDKTEFTQPSILTVSIATLRLLNSYGIQPKLAAGLSLGEYSAITCSGMISFKDAVRLVKQRGKFMQEAVPEGIGAMAAIIGLNESCIYKLCDRASSIGVVEPANFNCPGQIVIAGEINALKYACDIAKDMGALRAIMLKVSGPFHTSMLKPAAEKLQLELGKIKFNKGNIPVLTNVTGDYLNELNIKNVLKKQVMTSVKWQQTIENMIKDKIDTFIEIGPGKTLSTFVKKVNRNMEVYNVQDINSLNKVLKAFDK